MTAIRAGTNIGQFRWLDRAPAMWHIPGLPRGERLAITTADLRWIDENGSERCLLRGFATDGCSLPWFARSFLGLDPWGKSLLQSLPHDAGYTLQDYVDFQWLGTKEQVDRRFLIGGIANGDERANLYYRAVSSFGGPSWRRRNQPLVDGYVFACRHAMNDDWIDFVMSGKIVSLKEA